MTKKSSFIFNENGSLNDLGKQLISGLVGSIEMLFNADTIQDLSDEDLRLLGANIQSIIGNAISKQIVNKEKISKTFNSMSDEQFEKYLENKYGAMWRFMSLTAEEFERVPRFAEEEIVKAIEQGVRDFDHQANQPHPYFPNF